MLEERTESTTAWAVAFLLIAIAMAVAGIGAIWLGVAFS